MTPEEMKVAVCEDVFWKCCEPKPRVKASPFARWSKDGEIREFRNLTDYPRDLNAIMPLLPVGFRLTTWLCGNGLVHYHFSSGLLVVVGTDPASAACEFYLRTVGKWKETST